MAVDDWRGLTRSGNLGYMTAPKYHRASEDGVNGFIRGGYRTADNRVRITKSGYQWVVWVIAEDGDIQTGEGFPWAKSDVYALVDEVEGRYYVHRWDSVTLGDAKYEVERDIYA